MPNLPTNDCPICGVDFPALDSELHGRLLRLPAASAEEVMRLAIDLVEFMPCERGSATATSNAAVNYAPPAGFNHDLHDWGSLHDPTGEIFAGTAHAFLEFLGDTWRDQLVARRFTTAVWALDAASDRLIPRLSLAAR